MNWCIARIVQFSKKKKKKKKMMMMMMRMMVKEEKMNIRVKQIMCKCS